MRYCLQPWRKDYLSIHCPLHLELSHHRPPNVLQLYILCRTVYSTVIVLKTAREHLLPLLVDSHSVATPIYFRNVDQRDLGKHCLLCPL